MKIEADASTASMAPARLHVIVTCTDRKTLEPATSLRVSSLPTAPLADRLLAWTRELETAPSRSVTANELYSGDQWHVARSLSANAPIGVEVCTWVASAGYGLIKPETWLKPYAATFASRHPDAVVPLGAAYRAADWWRGLSAWSSEGSEEPRTVEAIARRAAATSNEFVLVAVSESYAIAMIDDIAAAAELLSDRFALISVGSRAGRSGSHPRPKYLMPGEAKLQSLVGGATHSLNTRVARRAVLEASRWLPSAVRLGALMQEWVDSSPPAIRYDRLRLSDDEVRAFLVDQLRGNPRLTCTALLRTLRNSGNGCEQARFAALFHEAVSKLAVKATQVASALGAAP